MGKKIKVREDGIYPPAAAMLADMWENEPYNGHVINNLLTDNVIVNPVDDKPTMHYRIAYIDVKVSIQLLNNAYVNGIIDKAKNPREVVRDHFVNYLRSSLGVLIGNELKAFDEAVRELISKAG